MRYLLDANVFITAKNRHYGFAFCPGFWDWLLVAHAQGVVGSTTSVKAELEVGDEEELTAWVNSAPPTFFANLGPEAQSSLKVVSTWVNGQSYEPSAKNTFFQAADYLLIAHAHAIQATIVTHEIMAATNKRVKIPNVCHGFGVGYLPTYRLLASEKVRLVLGGSTPSNAA